MVNGGMNGDYAACYTSWVGVVFCMLVCFFVLGPTRRGLSVIEYLSGGLAGRCGETAFPCGEIGKRSRLPSGPPAGSNPAVAEGFESIHTPGNLSNKNVMLL